MHYYTHSYQPLIGGNTWRIFGSSGRHARGSSTTGTDDCEGVIQELREAWGLSGVWEAWSLSVVPRSGMVVWSVGSGAGAVLLRLFSLERNILRCFFFSFSTCAVANYDCNK